jgi:hypothetical protein
MSFLHQVPDRSTLTSMQLPQYNDKQESNQTTKPRKTTEREATRHRKERLHRKNTKRENNIALSADVRSLGQKNWSGCLLSTSLSLSLASTSWVDRVDLYGLNRNGIGSSLS